MDPTAKGAKKMTEEERLRLAQKLDEEMAEYLAALEKKAQDGPGYTEGWREENWEQEMESHPFFATNEQLIEDAAKGTLSPLMEGLQQLKYSPDENSPEELARNYKEDGNFQFKLKKYRLAVAAYTEGIRCKSKEELITVQLITNRAAAQFHLGNYRSSFNDCRLVVKLKPDHFKAVKRGAICCHALGRFADCIEWSEKALKLEPCDKEVLTILQQSREQIKEAERNARKEAVAKKKQLKKDAKLVAALQSRGVKLKDVNLKSVDVGKEEQISEVIEMLVPKIPNAAHKRVNFTTAGETLVWPVLFMYPEYGETDLIEEFEEVGQFFSDHLQAMFGHGIERPVWDIQNKYVPERLKIYFEDRITDPDKVALIPLKDTNTTLGEVLADPRYEVAYGLPTFIVLVEKSPYEAVMIKTYEHPHLK